jgi:glycosyltransferase involved in cell wall biosynthesis
MQEAAAFEVPSVVVGKSSAAEGIEDGVNGFTVENDAENLAQKLRNLMNHPIAIKWAGIGARKSIYRPWETIVDDVYLRYKDLVRSRQSLVNQQAGNDDEL